MRQRICPECGAEFRPLHGSQVCCSDECRRKRHLRQIRESRRRKIKHLSPHQRMLANLRQRDAVAPKPKTEIIYHNGVIIERRGTVPLGCHAVGIIRHNT